jgi:hypothetical protein
VRAVSSGLRRCGDWATKAVGDRDGKSSDDTSRHLSRPQLQLQHRSVDVHAVTLPEPDAGYHVAHLVGPRPEAVRAVLFNKSGLVDGSGTRRLEIQYLGMLIAHEVGHSSPRSAPPPRGGR